ncbi:MAG: polyamine ABC transporter substrate-binding protein [Janthinobacterium lividum]
MPRPVLRALLVLSVLGVAPARAEEKVLNVYNWSDYIGADTVAAFEHATGITVHYDVYDSNEVLEAKLLAGHSGYDLVVPSAEPFLARQIKAGVYRPLDRARIPNWGNLDPAMMAAVAGADPGNAHGAIWAWSTTGLGENTAKIRAALGADAPLDSLAVLFDPKNAAKLRECGITMLDSAAEVFPVALHYLGLDPASQDLGDLKKAEALLMSVRPYVRYFHSSQYINDLANGGVCLSLGFSGDVLIAAQRAHDAGNGVGVEYRLPREGTIESFDMMAIPADAPHPEAAEAFINFVLQPAVMAGISNTVFYANGVPATKPLLRPALADNPNVFPAPGLAAKLFPGSEVGARYERERTRAWTSVTTGH